MKFFFADSFDTVDGDYDFLSDDIRRDRCRQRSDLFAHEILTRPPYDGLLLSRATFEGWGGAARFSPAQRVRFLSQGAREFYRFPSAGYSGDPLAYPLMGDCGSFSYRTRSAPPCGIDDTLEYYVSAGFTHGVSPDHVILEKNDDWDNRHRLPPSIRERAAFTRQSARDFIRACQAQRAKIIPVGAVQGWSASSMARMAKELCEVGYDHLGLGGLAARRTEEIQTVLGEVRAAVPHGTNIHIFGFNRLSRLTDFRGLGLDSFDSTSPLLKAFRDDRDNYFSPSGKHYLAIKIPPLRESRVMNAIASGVLQHEQASLFEARALASLRSYAARSSSLDEALASIFAYESLVSGRPKRPDLYERTLRDRPWEKCECEVCRRIGVEVIIYRGLNRNKRRGYHNLFVAYQMIKEADDMQYIEVPCLRAEQAKGRDVYSFVVDGKDITRFAALSRVRRSADGVLQGYQRPEIADHIEDIRRYLAKPDSILPNSIVVAFDRPLEFELVVTSASASMGRLRIPLDEESRPGWIVDGQQRAAALRRLEKSPFPVSVVAFQSSGPKDEREQFVLVNNTRPLPKSLIYELLPSIGRSAPPRLIKRQRAYVLLERLNLTEKSPFFMRIRTTTLRHVQSASIADTSVLRMIENSRENGALGHFMEDDDSMLRLLWNFWSAVRNVFSQAWEMPPSESRLTHGAGIVSMGHLMDAITFRIHGSTKIPAAERYERELQLIAADLPWIDGVWRLGKDIVLPWNEIQNTSRHIDLVTSALIRRYRSACAPCDVVHQGGDDGE